MKPATALPPVDQGRRDFLRLGMTGTLVLSTVSFTAMLSGCASVPPAAGLRVLRAPDVVILRALMPVVLAGALPSDDSRERVLDESINLLDGLLAAREAGRWQPSEASEARRLDLLPQTAPLPWDELMHQPAYLQALAKLP